MLTFHLTQSGCSLCVDISLLLWPNDQSTNWETSYQKQELKNSDGNCETKQKKIKPFLMIRLLIWIFWRNGASKIKSVVKINVHIFKDAIQFPHSRFQKVPEGEFLILCQSRVNTGVRETFSLQFILAWDQWGVAELCFLLHKRRECN